MAVAIGAFIFMALSSALASGLRTLAVQKARAKGNDVATQAIEDLQRYAFERLAVCGPPSPDAAPPPGIDPALHVRSTSTNCPGPTNPVPDAALRKQRAEYGDQPCSTTAAGTGIPRSIYTCRMNNIDYLVKRYVVWTDNSRTAKRVAVFVEWDDLVGNHQVSQQSSLRSPVTGDIVGIDPPSFIPAANQVSPRSHTSPSPAITFTIDTNGLTSVANDRVYVSFTSIVGGAPTTTTVALQGVAQSGGVIRWSRTINPDPATPEHVFPQGTQFITFNAVRATDGKSSGLVDSATSEFCPCSASMPKFSPVGPQMQSYDVIDVDETGRLLNAVTVRAKTTNLVPNDSVVMQFVTRTGVVSAFMQADDADPACTALIDPVCQWTGQISATAGYPFQVGDDQLIYFAASQGSSGSSASAQSNPIDFRTP